MTDYKIHPVRFAGKIQSYVVTINGKTFINQGKGVTIYAKDFTRTIKNSFLPDFKSEEEVFEYFRKLEEQYQPTEE